MGAAEFDNFDFATLTVSSWAGSLAGDDFTDNKKPNATE
jgi:hypothetical protein